MHEPDSARRKIEHAHGERLCGEPGDADTPTEAAPAAGGASHCADLLRFEGGKLSRMLRRAIEAGELRPVFQPRLDLRTRQITGFEILARWYDPVLGAIAPDEFIPVADAEGLLTLLTGLLLHQACAAAAAWPGDLSLALNISPLQLRDRSLPAFLRNIAEEHGFSMSRIEIEITAQALHGPVEAIRATVEELKALGATIVMDDFGAGHAGLVRLSQLPFDKIKIDRSFVQSLSSGEDSAKIIAAVVGLGLSLGVATVAGGVEDQHQADVLARLGITVSQGWLHGRPVPADQVPRLLEEANQPPKTATPATLGSEAAPQPGSAEDLKPRGPTPDIGCSLPPGPEPVAPPTPAPADWGRPCTQPVQPLRPEHMDALFHAAPVGLALLDLEFRYVTVNEYFAQMHHLPAGYFVGKTVHEALPATAAETVAQLESALTTGEIVGFEFRVAAPRPRNYLSPRDAGGPQPAGPQQNPPASTSSQAPSAPTPPPERVFLRTARTVRDADGRVIGVSIAKVDITERKQAELALRQSEEDLRHAVELSPHIPWTSDPSGELLSMSPRWHALTDSTPEELAQRGWVRYVHPDDMQGAIDRWMRAVRTGEPLDSTYRIACALNGETSWRWVHARAFPRRNAAGEILRWYGTIEDIHDRKTAEAELLLKAVRLEQATEQFALRAREDYLTGLANRRHLDDVLEREIGRARRGRPSPALSLIMLDVDRFKDFNDGRGHQAGDDCLRSIAAVLTGAARRKSDVVARYGGEEFVIVLPDTGEEGALEVARATCRAVRALAIEHPCSGTVTVSAGVAGIAADGYPRAERTPGVADAAIAADLLRAADFALYGAKTAGRDCVVSASTLRAQKRGTSSPALPGDAEPHD